MICSRPGCVFYNAFSINSLKEVLLSLFKRMVHSSIALHYSKLNSFCSFDQEHDCSNSEIVCWDRHAERHQIFYSIESNAKINRLNSDFFKRKVKLTVLLHTRPNILLARGVLKSNFLQKTFALALSIIYKLLLHTKLNIIQNRFWNRKTLIALLNFKQLNAVWVE